MLQPPPVKTASEEALIRFFGAVADASPLPIGIQNAPEYIGIGLSNAGLIALAERHPNVTILKAEGPALYIGMLAEDAQGRFEILNGRNGGLIDDLRAGCTGCIPGGGMLRRRNPDLRSLDARRPGGGERLSEILPLLHFDDRDRPSPVLRQELAARRVGLGEVHDRGPAQSPHPFGLQVLEAWSRSLGELGK